MERQKFTYKIDTDNPLAVEDFTKALVAINNEYKLFSYGSRQLQIEEIRKGSFEVDFAPIVIPTLFAATEQFNSVMDFLAHIKNIKDYIIGAKEIADEDKKPSMRSIQNCVDMTTPIINNYGSGNIYIFSGNDNKVLIDSNDAEQIKTFAPSILKEIPTAPQEQNSNILKKQLFYWYQTRFDDKKTNSGNKGIIESISSDAVNVIFEDDNSLTKQEMTTSQDGVDWQKRGYIVDVEIMRKDNKIVKYKIIHNYMNESVADGALF